MGIEIEGREAVALDSCFLSSATSNEINNTVHLEEINNKRRKRNSGKETWKFQLRKLKNFKFSLINQRGSAGENEAKTRTTPRKTSFSVFADAFLFFSRSFFFLFYLFTIEIQNSYPKASRVALPQKFDLFLRLLGYLSESRTRFPLATDGTERKKLSISG